MSQSYDPTKPASGVTTFGALYQVLRDHFAAVVSQFSGTSFPASAVAGQLCWRTDRGVYGYGYRYTGNPAVGETGWVEDAILSSIGVEVIAARGSKSSLDARLDVALNEDGTLKAGTSLNPSQWANLTGHTFTYSNTTTFTVDGDQTDIYKATRRIKANLTAGAVYSEVVSAIYGAPNTSVVIKDAVLDNTLTSVEHSLFLPYANDGAMSADMLGALSKSLYDAYSILMSTTDNTPVAITIAEQTVVGRLTGGAIQALSATELVGLVNNNWKQTAGTFTATPASTSTLTMTSDLTASILVGMALKYTIGGTTYYGRVSAITSNLLTVNGAPLSGDVTALYYGGGTVRQIQVIIPSTYENASDTALIANDLKSQLIWSLPKSYLVAYAVYSATHDTGSHGQASVRINDTEVNTTTGGLTIAADATWYSTVVDIATAAYDVNLGEAIEITCVKGGNGDASDMTVLMIFVTP